MFNDYLLTLKQSTSDRNKQFDLIYYITEIENRRASGPVLSNIPSVAYIDISFLGTVKMQNGYHKPDNYFFIVFRLTKGRVKARQRKMHQVINQSSSLTKLGCCYLKYVLTFLIIQHLLLLSSFDPFFKLPPPTKYCMGLFIMYVTSFLSISCSSNSENKTLFNSCERLLWGTLILDIKHWNNRSQIGTNSLTLSTT